MMKLNDPRRNFNQIDRTRGAGFSEYLDKLPRHERLRVVAAERVYVTKAANLARHLPVFRAYEESMNAPQEDMRGDG